MWSFHRVLHLLLLPTLCLAAYPKIDDELIAKAKAGQWIYLDDEDDTMIKLDLTSQPGIHTVGDHVGLKDGEGSWIETVRCTCLEHSTCSPSPHAKQFQGYFPQAEDLALAVYKSDGGASDYYVRFPTGWLGSWSDGSSTDYVRKKLGHKCIWMLPEGITRVREEDTGLTSCDSFSLDYRNFIICKK